MLTTLERIGKARELQAAGASLAAGGDALKRTMLRRKVEGLRALLLGRRVNTITDLDLFNPSACYPVIRAYMDSLKDASEVERTEAGAYLKIITKYLLSVDRQSDGDVSFRSPGHRLNSDAKDMDHGHKASYLAAQFTRLHDAGREAYDLPVLVKRSLEELNQISSEQGKLSREMRSAFDAAREEAMKSVYPLLEAMHEATEKFEAGDITFDEYRAARTAYNQAADAAVANIQQDRTGLDKFRARKEAAQEVVSTATAKLKQGVLDASPISQAQADAWAKTQKITPAASARLKKLGYDPKQARADMAEFYRLTGGRLAKITIASSGGKRANAEGIHGHVSSIINMGSRFDKRTLFHEMAHHLEADPVAVAAANGFLAKRRETPETHALRDLTGNRGYGPRERAYKDSFFSAYVGKVYDGTVTEVFSMGVESFSDPAMLADRIAKDPEMFSLMLGFLKTPPNPLFGSVKKVFEQIADAEAAATDLNDSELDEALGALAQGVEFVKVDPAPAFPWFLNSQTDSYVGSFDGLDLYQAKSLRDPITRRRKAGLMLCGSDLPKSYSGLASPRLAHISLFGGMQEAQATARVWSKTGQPAHLADAEGVKLLAKHYAPTP